MTKVVPLNSIPIASLNPDLNNDGRVDEWESKVFSKLIAADADGDGELSRQELFAVMRDLNAASKNGEIPIAALNPDTDGDGKIEQWEKEVYGRIIKADTDHT